MIEISSLPTPAIAREEQHTIAPSAQTTARRDFGEVLRSVSHRGQDLDPIFAEAAQTYQVPQELLRAIGFHESGFESDAVSSAGAMGIMQLMPATAQTMGVSNPFDARQNIMGGAKLLGQLLGQYDGDLKLTLAAYGAGSGAVAKYGGVPPYEETRNFVEDILSAMDMPKTGAAQAVPADQPAYQKYPTLYEQMLSTSDYTREDYQIFLSFLLNENVLGLFDSEEQTKEQATRSLFYLG